ncbi:MAG: glutamate--cysteine ligase [Bacteroidetes bacterium]|nr:MAG: glutamate--cysteine ligase [Bacteroidota bacterium]MBL1144467.1 glutamate--cysteine ligase [Bacteroidota bacterium]MCB0803928.1 glutamate--cysteine ligase [Flavobacteriales bacterium]NOG57262.1 glutamate--cysteine ligase [Bacteroidota bacterium]
MSENVKKPLALFEAYGIELEYMIVDRDTLAIRPIADLLLEEMAGDVVADFENGDIAWSNELVLHVIEIKTNGPAKKLEGLAEKFSENVALANKRLEKHNAMLLPTGAHPFMNPLKETIIWPHEYNEVYELYNRIFDCKGHGWSNLQSTHINLPFANDEEFKKLHAAIRLVLPLIPALSASTPIFELKHEGIKNQRLEFYKLNQSKIPQIAGKVIPERAFSQNAYEELIFQPIKQAIRPYDKDGILGKYFLNSRGAIARFDRNAIEIRIVDIQESPKMDLAIMQLVSKLIQFLIDEKTCTLAEQMKWNENDLFAIFNDTIKNAEDSIIDNVAYLKMFGIEQTICSAKDFWKEMQYATTNKSLEMDFILEKGSLATRILKAVNQDYSKENILRVYRKLGDCLSQNKAFE